MKYQLITIDQKFKFIWQNNMIILYLRLKNNDYDYIQITYFNRLAKTMDQLALNILLHLIKTQ